MNTLTRRLLLGALTLTTWLSVTAASAQDNSSFYEFIASRCLVDELARTEYAQGWETWMKPPNFIGPDEPLPGPRPVPQEPLPPAQAKARAAELESAWQSKPRSHVVDCSFEIPRRKCPGCQGKGNTRANYIAYLPEALITSPEKVNAILLLVPGGNGGRTRYFLTPIPNKTIHHKKSGGLETRRRVDDWLEDKPDAVAPIVVALDSGGYLSVNGPTEYLTHDIQRHLADTFLGGKPSAEIAWGAEGISSGGRVIMDALRQKPGAFQSVGLTCMHCRRFGGIDPNKDLGTPAQRDQWLAELSRLHKEKQLEVRFSVGNRDNQWPCNKEFHDLFVKAGLRRDDPPVFDGCEPGYQNHKTFCSVTWDGFHLYNGQGHHYGLLLDSWVPQLYWHLDTLAAISRSRHQP